MRVMLVREVGILVLFIAGCAGSRSGRGGGVDTGPAGAEVLGDAASLGDTAPAADLPSPDVGALETASPPPEAGPESDAAPAGRLALALGVELLSQDCFDGPGPSDSVRFRGKLTINNEGDQGVGPVSVAGASFVAGAGEMLARFRVRAGAMPRIQPGETVVIAIEKEAGSLEPARRCETLKCDARLRAHVEIAGAGVPPGAGARSDDVRVACVY